MPRRPRAPLLFVLPLLACAALLAVWATFPVWAPPLLRWQLAQRGIQLDTLTVRRPGWRSLRIDEFALHIPGDAYSFKVHGAHATLHYRPRQLLAPHIDRIEMAWLQMQIDANANAKTDSAPIALTEFLPKRWFTQLPLDSARIQALQLRTPLPRLAQLDGSLDYSARRLQLALRDDQTLALQLSADADNQIDLLLRDADRELVAIANRFIAAPTTTAIDGHMRIDFDAVQKRLPTEFAQLRGTAAANWRGVMPNAIDRQSLRQLTLRGDFNFDGTIALPQFAALPQMRATVTTSFQFADGSLAGTIARGSADLQLPAPTAIASFYKLKPNYPLPVAIRIGTGSAYRVDVAQRQLQLTPAHIDIAVRDRKAGIDVRTTLDDLAVTFGDAPAASAHAIVELPALPFGDMALNPTLLDTRLQLLDRRITARWQWRDVANLYRFDGTADYRLDNGNGTIQARSQPLTFRENGKYLPAMIKGWHWPLDFSSGSLTLQASANWNTTGVRADAVIETAQLGGFYNRNLFRGVDAKINAAYASDARSGGNTLRLTAQPFVIAEVQSGFPIRNIRGELQFENNVALLRGFRAELFGGEVTGSEALRYEIGAEQNSLALQLTNLQLTQILALQDGVEGTGVIDGNIPLLLHRDGIRIDGAKLQARAPGGVLRYRVGTPSGAAQNPGLALAFKALENFHYDTMSVQANFSLGEAYGDQSGDLLLAVALKGRNPTAPDTPPIHFNLNIRENIPDLIQTLQIGENISDRIEQRIKQLQQTQHASDSKKTNDAKKNQGVRP